MAPALSEHASTGAPKIHRVGTLAYTSRQLFTLMAWLLAGDLLFVLIEQIDNRVLPVLLRQHQATDQQIAIIISSFSALTQFFINPIVSYRSDRKRSRRGRRIPYLLWATPFVGLFLGMVPFSPEITDAALRVPWITRALAALPWAPMIVVFALVILMYQVFERVVGAVYFYLFRDVVPPTHIGRFFTLFRICGAAGVFILQYWVIGLTASHPRTIFVGISALYVVGFLAMCFFVREGEYPPVVDAAPPKGFASRFAPARAVHTFAVESFRSPLYLWTYFTRLTIYATITALAFVVFFAREDLGMTYDRAGKLLSWSSFAWILVAYPLARLLDRWGSMRVLGASLWLIALTYTASFFGIVGERSFLGFTLCSGVLYWVVMLAQIVLVQQVFHPARMGQLSSANAMVQSLAIAFVLGPAIGWLLETIKGFQATFALPWVGLLEIRSYRFVYLILALLSFLSLFGYQRLRYHWRQHGGPDHYAPPPVC